jgi:predicted transcriptional regulator
MNKLILDKRNKIIWEIWENEKGSMTMKDLADIFNMPLPTCYRILKEENSKAAEPAEPEK